MSDKDRGMYSQCPWYFLWFKLWRAMLAQLVG